MVTNQQPPQPKTQKKPATTTDKETHHLKNPTTTTLNLATHNLVTPIHNHHRWRPTPKETKQPPLIAQKSEPRPSHEDPLPLPR